MKFKTKLKIIIDLIMTVMLLIQMAFLFFGQELHEWIGISLFLLFVIHHLLNFHWIRNIMKGKYSPYRIILTVVNTIVLLSMIGLIISGITMSQYVLQNAEFGLSMSFARKLHMVAAYGGYIFMSIHIGLHWAMFMGMSLKMRNNTYYTKRWIVVMRVTAVLIACYGIYAFVEHDILSYVFLVKEFVFFDFEQPVIFFFIDYLAIMGFWIFIAHYTAKITKDYK